MACGPLRCPETPVAFQPSRPADLHWAQADAHVTTATPCKAKDTSSSVRVSSTLLRLSSCCQQQSTSQSLHSVRRRAEDDSVLILARRYLMLLGHRLRQTRPTGWQQNHNALRVQISGLVKCLNNRRSHRESQSTSSGDQSTSRSGD
jgi:hypothetical protein